MIRRASVFTLVRDAATMMPTRTAPSSRKSQWLTSAIERLNVFIAAWTSPLRRAAVTEWASRRPPSALRARRSLRQCSDAASGDVNLPRRRIGRDQRRGESETASTSQESNSYLARITSNVLKEPIGRQALSSSTWKSASSSTRIPNRRRFSSARRSRSAHTTRTIR